MSDDLADKLIAAEAENARLRAFTREALFEFWEYEDPRMQDAAVKYGLLVFVPYDPEKHSEWDLDPGDTVLEFAPCLKERAP